MASSMPIRRVADKMYLSGGGDLFRCKDEEVELLLLFDLPKYTVPESAVLLLALTAGSTYQ